MWEWTLITYTGLNVLSFLWLVPRLCRGDEVVPRPLILSAPLIVLTFPLLFGVAWLHSLFLFVQKTSFVKGTPDMIRRLFSIRASLAMMAFCWLIGVRSPNLMDRATDWYYAPPAPPSAEAKRLIDSLESLEGWNVNRKDSVTNLKKGELEVTPSRCCFESLGEADVFINGGDCSKQFSSSDRKAINKAVGLCLRKLTVKAVEKTSLVSK